MITESYISCNSLGEEILNIATIYDKKKTIRAVKKETPSSKIEYFKQTGKLVSFTSLPNYEFIILKDKELNKIILVETSSGMIADICLGSTIKDALSNTLRYSPFKHYIDDEEALKILIQKAKERYFSNK